MRCVFTLCSRRKNVPNTHISLCVTLSLCKTGLLITVWAQCMWGFFVRVYSPDWKNRLIFIHCICFVWRSLFIIEENVVFAYKVPNNLQPTTLLTVGIINNFSCLSNSTPLCIPINHDVLYTSTTKNRKTRLSLQYMLLHQLRILKANKSDFS